MLNRERLEQYLDGELPPDEATQLDAALTTDSEAREIIAHLRRERALRQAALHTYAPTAAEAGTLAGRWLDEFHAARLAPLARIGGRWLRRTAGVAAAAAIAIGSFWAGHATAVRPQVYPPTAEQSFVVKFVTPDGVIETQKFSSSDEATAYANKLVAQQQGVSVATLGGVL